MIALLSLFVITTPVSAAVNTNIYVAYLGGSQLRVASYATASSSLTYTTGSYIYVRNGVYKQGYKVTENDRYCDSTACSTSEILLMYESDKWFNSEGYYYYYNNGTISESGTNTKHLYT